MIGRTLSRWAFRLRLWRFSKAPANPRAPDGRFMSRREWRLDQMRRAGQ